MRALCICCGSMFEIKHSGWVNNATLNTEGFCDGCLETHSKTELIDMAVGQ